MPVKDKATYSEITGDNNLEDISDTGFPGVYKIAGDPICRITLLIKKDKSGYLYTFRGDTFTGSGRISFRKKEGLIYIYFNGTFCSGNNETVTGFYSDKTITIRNYGNSMGRYTCFRECDSRHLRFVKN